MKESQEISGRVIVSLKDILGMFVIDSKRQGIRIEDDR